MPPQMAPTTDTSARAAAVTRLAIGLLQGVLLFLLQQADESKAWPATQPILYAPLLVCALMVPMIPLAALSAMRRTPLIVWTLAAAALTAILATHAAWTGVGPDRLGAGPLSPPVFIAAAALLFIAHHLVQPAEAAGRPVAPYADYFDLAWTNAVRLALSVAFTGAFWLLLFLAGALFKLIGVSAIETLIGETAFAFPATGLMFAAAVHTAVQLTEARAGLVRGVRTVALILLAWLLPLMVVIAAGFLATLPFTGLAPLWGTKAATALLLSAAAALIVLINAAYQDGVEPAHAIPRWAARIAGLLLIPIVVLAAYALWLRVQQYGLTPDRVFAAAYLLVATGFTIGYAIAALRPGAWMKPLEPTNLTMAAVCVLLIIALFTPIADPARLSVADQVRRLERGKVTADKFDFDFLRFDSGPYGKAALERLKAGKDKTLQKLAAAAALRRERNNIRSATVDDASAENGKLLETIKVYPLGSSLPESFKRQYTKPTAMRIPFCAPADKCVALVRDVDGAEGPEVLVTGEGGDDRIVVYRLRKAQNDWEEYGYFQLPNCGISASDIFASGDLKGVPSYINDLEIRGRRFHLSLEQTTCGFYEPGQDKGPEVAKAWTK